MATVRIFYENAGSQVLFGGIATFGHVFKPGELPGGLGLTTTVGGKPSQVQVDVKTTYPDGSAAMAVVTAVRPDIPPGASVEAVMSVGPAVDASAVDLAKSLKGHSFDVALTPAGGTTQTVDVLHALGDALKEGTASFWQQGPLATQARVEVPLEGAQRLIVDVTAYKSGGFSVEAQFANDGAMETDGGRANYGVTVRMDGAVVAQESVSQGLFQNWHRGFASNGTDGGQGIGDPTHGWLNIRHDIAHLQETGAIAEYNLSTGISPTLLDAYAAATKAADWGDALSVNGVTQYMPGVGGRQDIGFTTGANTSWLISQDMRAANYAMGQAETASAVPWNMWDARHGTWLSTDDYPHLWTDYRGGTGVPGDASSTGLTQRTDANTGWSLDPAHQPDLSYVPYLLTGERWMLDNLQAQASWNVVAQWPLVRGDGDDIVVRENQVRGAAWALRQIDEAAWISPNGSEEKAYFTAVSKANWSWLVSQIPTWTAQQGEAHGWLPGVYGAAGALPPWQQDYFASTAVAAASHGNADAKTFLEWMSNFLVGRFTHAAQGFVEHDGAAYLLAIGDPATGTPYKTWAEIGAHTVANGWSNGTGWAQSNGDYAQLALATLAGVAEVTGSAAAAQAYRDLLADAPPFTSAADFARDPTYSIEAPGTSSVAPTPVNTTIPVPTTPAPAPTTPTPVPTPSVPVPSPSAPVKAGDVVPVPVTGNTPALDVIKIGLSEDAWNGHARYSILVDGVEMLSNKEATAKHVAGATEFVTLDADLAPGQHAVTVKFLNDAWGGSAETDRNLYVASVSVNGNSLGDTASLFQTGDATFRFEELAWSSSVTTTPPPSATTNGLGDGVQDVLRIGVSADKWKGDPSYVVLMDGQQIGGEHVAKASHAQHAVEYLDVTTDLTAGQHTLGIRFLNDAWGGTASTDRNLYVESVSVNGESIGATAALYSAGDAKFRFGDTATAQPAPAAPTSSTVVPPAASNVLGDGPSDTIRIGVSADSWQGDPRFVVLVDGKQVGPEHAAQASHAQHAVEYLDVVVKSAAGEHTLDVRFLNDGWGGTPETDRNLYVESVALNGVDLHKAAALFMSGDALFNF